MKVLKLLLFCSLYCASFAQDNLFPFEENGLSGYIDSSGKVVIAPQFDHAEAFSEGLGAVSVKGKWGYIAANGNRVIRAIFSRAQPFHDGVAIVMMDSTFGLINQKGKFILKPVYQHIQFQAEGKIGAKRNDLWEFYTTTGKKLTREKYQWIGPFSEGLAMVQSTETGKYGFINEKGNITIPCNLRMVYTEFHNGYASVDDSIGRCFINPDGKNVFGKYYYTTSNFLEGRALVVDKYNENGYFITASGRAITDKRFNQAWGFHEGFCGASTATHFVVVDTNGVIVFSSPTIELRYYSGDYGVFCDHSNTHLSWGIMNKQQEIISAQRFTRICSVPGNSLVETFIGIPGELCIEGKHGYMNLHGQVIWETTTPVYVPFQ